MDEKKPHSIDTKRLKKLLAIIVTLGVIAAIIQLLLMVLTPPAVEVDESASEQSVSAASAASTAESSSTDDSTRTDISSSGASAEAKTSQASASSSSDGSEDAGDSGSDAESDASDTAEDSRSETSSSRASAPTAAQVQSQREDALALLVLDGAPAPDDLVRAVARTKRDYTQHVEYIDQFEVLPAGCEIVALAVVMRSMGCATDPVELADNYVELGGGTPESYQGDPYSDGSGMPPCIVLAANRWLEERGYEARAYNTTSTSADTLLSLVEQGYPVIAWTTENLVDPSDITEGENGMRWYWPEHSVVVYGVEGGEDLASDSMAGLVRYDRARFAEIYEACGSMSVALL